MQRCSALVCTSVMAAVTLGVATGCTGSEQTIVVLENLGCFASGGSDGTFVARGLVDTSSPFGYHFNPVVKNFATAPDTDIAQRLAFIRGADITISVEPGRLSGGDSVTITREFSGVVEPNGGETAFEFVILPVELLGEIGLSLAADGSEVTAVRVELTIFGEMSGGSIRTEPFVYWIDVCQNCINRDVGDCTALPQDFVASTGGECNAYQDEFVDCCTDVDTTVCPAQPMTPP